MANTLCQKILNFRVLSKRPLYQLLACISKVVTLRHWAFRQTWFRLSFFHIRLFIILKIIFTTVIVMALLNYGFMSFVLAVLLRSIVGLVLIFWFSFWVPSFTVSRASLKQLLTFGVPFQASSFLALFKDELIILYLGKV